MPRPRAGRAPVPRPLAILAADAVGYSRLMTADAGGTLALLDAARAVFRAEVERRRGRVVDTAGDSVLAAFDNAVAAVTTAIAVQRRLAATADADADASAVRLPFRIGVHLGDVIVKRDGSVYGDGVNVAARLQALAGPGGVIVSQPVHALVAPQVHAQFVDLGEQTLKNIAPAIRTYELLSAETADVWRFGRFELQPRARRLLADGRGVPLAAPTLDVLIALVERAGSVVARSDLVARAWPGAVVADAELGAQLGALRRLLGIDAIVTLPGRGIRFAAGLESAASTPVPAPPQAQAAVKLKTNLPVALVPLIGRDDELAALEALVGRHRLVSIVGAGGIGKSLLAQHLLRRLAPRYRHGVCFVELAASARVAEIPGVVAAALGVALAGDASIADLARAVAPLQLLLALDNAEHLLDGVAALAAALHETAGETHVVTTSQAPLKLAAERVHRLGALAVPQGVMPAREALAFGAVALFVERARAADSRFEIGDGQVGEVIRLCRALDGHPLALELAAARAPTLGLRGLAESMPQRLKVLTRSANRLAPARQRTLRATLEWSHGLLDGREQIVFRRLAVFAGNADLPLIRQVVADADSTRGAPAGLDEWAVLDALDILVERSLVVALAGTAEQPRFRLFDTPREFALAQLAAAGEEAALRERHAIAVATRFAAAHDERFDGSVGVDDWEARLQPDLDNAREALAWAQAASRTGLALAIAPAAWWATVSTNTAAARTLAEACEALALQAPADAAAGRAVLAAAQHWSDARPQRAATLAQWTVERERERAQRDAGADARWLYLALCCSACALAHSSPAAAEAPLHEARELEQPDWPPVIRAGRSAAEARWAAASGDAELSLRASEAQLQLTRAAGYAGHVATSGYADALLHAGDTDGAVRAGEALVAQMDGTRYAYSLGYARLNLAAAYLARDDAAAARRVCEAGWPDAVRFEMNAWWADYLALLAALEGRWADAAQLAGYADAAYRRQQDQRQPNEGAAVERARTSMRRALGDAAAERLEAQGAQLRDAEVGAIALALPGSPAEA